MPPQNDLPRTPLSGIINLDKPAGITSARAVGAVKRLLPRPAKIGHAGTLDPFATGVLLLLVGKATKRCEELMGQPKQYLATVQFGATTATDDLESEAIPTPGALPISRVQIDEALPRFIGHIDQRPPAFSAMKVGGRRAYDLARKGNDVRLEPRKVRVDSIEIVRYAWPTLELKIDCGRGTYIRSIARDLGETLQVGGYLTALRRTRVGPFTADTATTLEILSRDGVERFLSSL